jgi:hypothetical protein
VELSGMDAPHLKQNMLNLHSWFEYEFDGQTYFICEQKAIGGLMQNLACQ